MKSLFDLGRGTTPEERAASDAETERWQKAREAEPEFCRKLQDHLNRYMAGPRDKESLRRYFSKVANACDEVPGARDLGGLRQKIVGRYFEAGMALAPKTGRPKNGRSYWYLHHWLEIERERLAQDLPFLAVIPGADIARRCNAELRRWRKPHEVNAPAVSRSLKRAGLKIQREGQELTLVRPENGEQNNP